MTAWKNAPEISLQIVRRRTHPARSTGTEPINEFDEGGPARRYRVPGTHR
jgi:hypothetical protein